MNQDTDSERYFPSRDSAMRNVLWIASIALVYHLTARFSLHFLQPGGIAAIWPPEGIFLSSILLTRRKLRPWLVGVLFAADWIAELEVGIPPLVSAAYSLALTGTAVLSSWLLLHFVGGPISFRRVREVLGFLALAVCLSNGLMSLAAAAASLTVGETSFWTSWKQWAASDGIGNLLVTPFILSWVSTLRAGLPRWNLARAIEGTILFVPMAVVNYMAFNQFSHSGEFSLMLTYLTFPFLIWAALRFGVPGVASASIVLAVIAIHSAIDMEPTVDHVFDIRRVFIVQFYVAILVVPSLFLAAIVAEREQAGRELRAEMARRRKAEEGLKLNAERVEALLALNQMIEAPLKEITDFAMETAIRLTGSNLGYVAFANEDESVLTMQSWSKSALAECQVAGKRLDYPVETTGLWGEAVRQRKAIITNDYAAPSPYKRGYPEGHVALRRHMNIPVFVGRRIVAVAGVANKAQPYDETDVQQLTLLMEGMWRLVERRDALEEITNINEDLLRSNRDLEQFAYVASHDLQEPLRMVTSYMNLLRSNYAGRLDKTADEFIDFASDGAGRMQQLITDLLAFSRIKTQGQAPRRVPVQAAFDRAVSDLRSAIAETGALITHDPLPEVLGDETQLAQLLMNLFGNAIKFRSDQPPRVHLGARRDGDQWIFSVRDNGIGIDPSNFDRIFQIFQRLHSRDKYTGSGIGLAICKRIVERHGGHIWVESQPGQGSTFFFTATPAPA